MQYDQVTPFAAKLRVMFEAPGMAEPLRKAIDALPAAERSKAREALDRLMAFDGKLAADSADAALYGAFLHESARQTFLDELGPEDTQAWRALVQTANTSYSAQADHLLRREDSPFWNDQRTAHAEDKPAILARSLAAAVTLLEGRLGNERSAWQWGKLHTASWTSGATQLAPHMPANQRSKINAIGSYLDRGPFAMGGDHSTLNASAYHLGTDFDTWLIPAMRIIVDFGRDEPMIGLNSSGQSGNPASPHYADGIDAWMKANYMSFPFKTENRRQVRRGAAPALGRLRRCWRDFQNADHAWRRVMPAHVHIPELRAVSPFRFGFLIGRARVLRQALLDKLHQGFAEPRCFVASLQQASVRPLHLDQPWRAGGHLVACVRQRVGVRHVGFDVQHRGAVQQVDAGNEQPIRFDAIQPDHRLTDAVGPVGRAGGEHADHAIAAQARRSHLETWCAFQRLMEEEQQPYMADLFESGHRIALVERRQQFQHAACGRGQAGLARNGELFLEAGADVADRRDAVLHGAGLDTDGRLRILPAMAPRCATSGRVLSGGGVPAPEAYRPSSLAT